MRGREFLGHALQLAAGPEEAYWRTGAVDAYYALVLERRDALLRWGFKVSRHNMHPDVRLRFTFAGDPDLKQIGDHLDRTGPVRSRASYGLRRLAEFVSDAEARRMIRRATDGLALLDAIEADPARLAAAIASIRP